MRWIRTFFLLCYALTLSSLTSSLDTFKSKKCLQALPYSIFLEQCPVPRDSEDQFTPALFPDPYELSVLSAEPELEEDTFNDIITLEHNLSSTASHEFFDSGEKAMHSTFNTFNDAAPTATSAVQSEERKENASAKRAWRAKSTRKPPLLSFEEWQKHILQTDNDRRHKRKPAGSGGRSQQMIDSLDGGFADDFGAMFEGEPDTETIDNTYDEGEYISPSNDAQSQTGKSGQTGEKRQFASIPLYALKERSNYASTDCAAIVRGVNKEARGSQSILYESKDQYMLNKCAADKYVIINLCEEILIDTIVLANFEFFSSTFKDFRVYVADRYPTKDWTLLGQWQARNTRDQQVFKVKDRIGWFEYIKIEFLTHYGHEYYCPLSLLRVHGMPMMEYYNLVERQGLSGDGLVVEEEHLWPSEVRQEIIQPQGNVTNTSESFPIRLEVDDNPPAILPVNDQGQLLAAEPEHDTPGQIIEESSDAVRQPETIMIVTTSTDGGRVEQGQEASKSTHVEATAPADPMPPQLSATSASLVNATAGISEAKEAVKDREREIMHSENDASPSPPASKSQVSVNGTHPSAGSTASATTITVSTMSNTNTEDGRSGQMKVGPNMHTKEANTQESIYKTIMKRLNALEINATLSQRYLDDQNKMLNDVFLDMEKRHQEQLITLLSRLNETASTRIDIMKRRYDQWYDDLKEQTDGEMREMTARLRILADQIAFERRVSVSQLVIVIGLFVFLALSRGTFTMLSPIMIAQAEERKRRESAESDTLQRKLAEAKRLKPNSPPLKPILESNVTEVTSDFLPDASSLYKGSCFHAVRPRAKSDMTHLKKPFTLMKAYSSDNLHLDTQLKADDEGSQAADSDDACVPDHHHPV